MMEVIDRRYWWLADKRGRGDDRPSVAEALSAHSTTSRLARAGA